MDKSIPRCYHDRMKIDFRSSKYLVVIAMAFILPYPLNYIQGAVGVLAFCLFAFIARYRERGLAPAPDAVRLMFGGPASVNGWVDEALKK